MNCTLKLKNKQQQKQLSFWIFENKLWWIYAQEKKKILVLDQFILSQSFLQQLKSKSNFSPSRFLLVCFITVLFCITWHYLDFQKVVPADLNSYSTESRFCIGIIDQETMMSYFCSQRQGFAKDHCKIVTTF